MKFLRRLTLVVASCIFVALTPSAHAQQQRFSKVVSANNPAWPLDPDLKSVLSYRTDQVSAAQTLLIPVLLDTIQTGNKPMPATVVVHCESAQLVYGSQQGNAITVPPMLTCFYLSLNSFGIQNGGPFPCRIWVTASDNPKDNLSQIYTIRITGRLTLITLLDTSKATPAIYTIGTGPHATKLSAPAIQADGVSTYTARVRITDYDGNPIPEVPCIIRCTDPEGKVMFIESTTATDDKGIVSVTSPPSKRPGFATIEIVTQCGSLQVPFQYVVLKGY